MTTPCLDSFREVDFDKDFAYKRSKIPMKRITVSIMLSSDSI